MADHKTALITGSSRGIGAATALLLGQQGYSICINYLRNKDAAEGIVAQLQKLGVTAISMRADVSDEGQVCKLFEHIDNKLGRLNALVNNAGVLLPQSTILGVSTERLNTLFRSNVNSAFLCCREAVKRMSTELGGPGGCIVNVSSAAARLGSPGEYIDYAASKGAIDTLTVGLALEVAQQGIRVNGVRPGFIDTDMHADGGEPGRIERVKSAIPLQRGGEASEVAATIAFLLSENSSYTTASIIDVAGGR
jgi:NAD(P)-dependent dehydrogenase (short-subunit alcohol dehydrogenase family)